MKKIILISIAVSLFILPINLSADDSSVNKINHLEKKMSDLTTKIDGILVNSRRAKNISIKYRKIAQDHLNVVTLFTEQKSECQNLEDIYAQKKSNQQLDRRVLRKQGVNVIDCYKTLETLIYDFEDMSRDFSKLKKSIGTMVNMAETDKDSITSIQKQVSVIEALIKMEKNKSLLNRETVEHEIDQLSK